MEDAKDEFKGIRTGNIKIASAATGEYVIPYFLSEFMHNHPSVNTSIDLLN